MVMTLPQGVMVDIWKIFVDKLKRYITESKGTFTINLFSMLYTHVFITNIFILH